MWCTKSTSLRSLECRMTCWILVRTTGKFLSIYAVLELPWYVCWCFVLRIRTHSKYKVTTMSLQTWLSPSAATFDHLSFQKKHNYHHEESLHPPLSPYLRHPSHLRQPSHSRSPLSMESLARRRNDKTPLPLGNRLSLNKRWQSIPKPHVSYPSLRLFLWRSNKLLAHWPPILHRSKSRTWHWQIRELQSVQDRIVVWGLL